MVMKRKERPEWRWRWRWRWNVKYLVSVLIVLSVSPPIFFHFRLRRLDEILIRDCGWLMNPPLVCAHGGDSISTHSFPNTLPAYRTALASRVDCIEIDVSRSSDGLLFALHDRDLQRLSGNLTSTVGFFTSKDINQLDTTPKFPKSVDDRKIPTVEDALKLVSNSVRQVILDAKVGPPLYEQGLAETILTVVKRARCTNCIVWAKSDSLVRDIIKLFPNISVGYIVMKDLSTGARSKLLRMKRAGIVGVFHPLIDENVLQILQRRNKKIYAWTVDDVVSMRDMLSKRVDAIVTSYPTILLQLMQDTRTQCLENGFSFP